MCDPFADGPQHTPLDGRLARQGFHAAPPTTTAPGSARLDDGMTKFSRVVCRSSQDVAAQDDAAADARADEGRDQVAMAPPRAQAKLRVAADAHVILHQDRAIEKRGKLRADRIILHVQVGAEEDYPALTSRGPGEPMPPAATSSRLTPARSSASVTHSVMA